MTKQETQLKMTEDMDYTEATEHPVDKQTEVKLAENVLPKSNLNKDGTYIKLLDTDERALLALNSIKLKATEILKDDDNDEELGFVIADYKSTPETERKTRIALSIIIDLYPETRNIFRSAEFYINNYSTDTELDLAPLTTVLGVQLIDDQWVLPDLYVPDMDKNHDSLSKKFKDFMNSFLA